MASFPSFWLFQLSLVFLSFSSLVHSAPWIVTDAYAKVVETEQYYYSSSVVTDIKEITPTVTSLPEALSTITAVPTTDHFYYQSGDVTVVQELYPTGVGKPEDQYDDYYDSYPYDEVTTVFKVNLTYTAPTSCSTQWTTTTPVDVTPPQIVRDELPRTAMATSISVDSSEPFEPTSYTYDIVYVDPTQVPSPTLSILKSQNRPMDLYGMDCYYNANDDTYSDSDTYTDSDDSYDDDGNYYYPYGSGSWFLNSYWMGISPLALTLILLLGWIGIFFLLGFIEAFIRFRRLMTGWQTRRGLPVCWALTILPITLLLLFYFRKGYRARSQADAEILQERWNAMSLGTRLRLFVVWGFRFRYPPMLGPAPARVKASKQPGENPGPRLLDPSPPRSVEQGSREGSLGRSAPGDGATAPSTAQPEMAEAEVAPAAHGAPTDDRIDRVQ